MIDFVPRVFSQTFGVVGGLLEKNGQFLLVKESQRKGPDDGKWSQPAGWIDVGENPIKAAEREVLEESGYNFKATHLLGVYSLVREDVKEAMRGTPHALKLIFIGQISGQASKLHSDVTETRWFTPEEIEAMDNATLRDADIKQMVKDYAAGQRLPLDTVKHTLQKPA